ncbi:fructose 1,6-bisphosphatase [Thermodesulfobium sp. 4217-1]|uniref:fructose 1,6-bisphosphatase n=1 Tax=Thermodesulfobium sp. 4217-1 TaxID=3120013 RepID=UPI0032221C91
MKIRLDLTKFEVSGYVDNASVHPAVIERLECFLSELVRNNEILDYNLLAISNTILLLISSNSESLKGADDIDQIIHNAMDNLKKCEYNFARDISGLKHFKNIYFSERKHESILIFISLNQNVLHYNFNILKMFMEPFSNIDLFKTELSKLYNINLSLKGHHKSYVQFKDVFKIIKDIKKSKSDFYIESIKDCKDEFMMASIEGYTASLWRVSEPFYNLNYILKGLTYKVLPSTLYDSSNFLAFPKSLAVGFSIQDGKLFGPVDLFDNSFFDVERNKFYKKF